MKNKPQKTDENLITTTPSPLERAGVRSKIHWKPGTLIYPLPAALISCGNSPEEYNVLTVSWLGTICSNPPMCYISVRKERHSYELIKNSGEFVINLTNEDMAYATDWCGVKSGKDFNKFIEMKLTPIKGELVNAPIIMESPLSIECRVKEIIPLGSHDMFIADVVNVQADKKYIDAKTDTFKLSDAKLIAYSHGHYYKLGEEIGKFGWTVQKKK
jgi:flavin reductase (DIM6/NTAB) family NADH-FMN oxidoreductase RutF